MTEWTANTTALDEACSVTCRPARARIDLDRLAANYDALQKLVARPRDAGGEGGRLRPRRAAGGAPAPGGGRAAPRRRLRRGGGRPARSRASSVPIVVLAAFGPGQERLLRKHDLTPVVSTPRDARSRARPAREGRRPLAVHLKVDTGMSRLGFTPDALRRPRRSAGRREGRRARGRDDPPGQRRRGRGRHRAAARPLRRRGGASSPQRGIRPRYVHACNSAGLGQFCGRRTRWCGPASLLYGVRPRPLSPDVDVRPVMTRVAPTSRSSRRCRRARRCPTAADGWRRVPRASAPSPSATRTACPARAGMRDQGQLVVRGGACRSAARCAWTSPWWTSPTGRRCRRATRPSSSATSPTPGRSRSGRAPTPGRCVTRDRPARAARVRRGRPRDRRPVPVCPGLTAYSAAWPHPQVQDRLRLPGLRVREHQVARPLPGLRRVEQLRRGAAGGAHRRGQGPRAVRCAETGAQPKPYDLVDGADTPRIPSGIGEFDRVLGRRHRARLHGPHRRGAGDRQEHAAAPGRAPARPRRAAPCSTSPARSRSGRSRCAASGSASRGAGLFLMAET